MYKLPPGSLGSVTGSPNKNKNYLAEERAKRIEKEKMKDIDRKLGLLQQLEVLCYFITKEIPLGILLEILSQHCSCRS
jgi:hypothetical protein